MCKRCNDEGFIRRYIRIRNTHVIDACPECADAAEVEYQQFKASFDVDEQTEKK